MFFICMFLIVVFLIFYLVLALHAPQLLVGKQFDLADLSDTVCLKVFGCLSCYDSHLNWN